MLQTIISNLDNSTQQCPIYSIGIHRYLCEYYIKFNPEGIKPDKLYSHCFKIIAALTHYFCLSVCILKMFIFSSEKDKFDFWYLPVCISYDLCFFVNGSFLVSWSSIAYTFWFSYLQYFKGHTSYEKLCGWDPKQQVSR